MEEKKDLFVWVVKENTLKTWWSTFKITSFRANDLYHIIFTKPQKGMKQLDH